MRFARSRPTLAATLAALLLTASAAVTTAQNGAQPTFVIDVKAGNASGNVAMMGAVIASIDAATYWFSDGTEVISITIELPDTDTTLPLLTLMSLEGEVVGDHIEVTTWAPLDLMMAAVVRTPEEAAEAFQTWIITQNSQAPAA